MAPIKTIIQLKNEINEQHYHDKGKAVYMVLNGVRHGIQSIDEYDDEVLISCDDIDPAPQPNGGEVVIDADRSDT